MKIIIILSFFITALFAETVVNPITGRTWMDKNLGASRVALSITDSEAFGDLYQWGRLSDGHESRNSSTTNITSNSDIPGHSLFILSDPDWRSPENDNLWQGLDGINNPCPSGFRLPTEEEFEEERLSWTTNDGLGAFNSPLKFTLTGARSRMNGQIGNIGTFAGYRTSSLSENGSSRVMGMSENNAFMGTRERADGNCIRCIIGLAHPIIDEINAQQTYEDTPFLVEVTATSSIGSQITYNAQSDTSAMEVYMDESSLVVGLQQHWNGRGNITVIATDENQLSDTTTFTVTVLPVNDSPLPLELMYPTILDTIPVSVDTDETIPFVWGESIDIDSEVSYKLTITLDYFGTSYINEYENIADTTYGVSAYEYAILMTNLNLPRWNIDYTIQATDREYTVISEQGEFVFDNASLSIDGEITPGVFALHQNYPNPFNPTTSLRYDLPNDGLVNITIYNMMGRIVKTLVNGSQTAGFKSVQWNATNNQGEPVSAAVYLYTIQAGEFRQTKKMVLLK
jgi:hypothetical protein